MNVGYGIGNGANVEVKTSCQKAVHNFIRLPLDHPIAADITPQLGCWWKACDFKTSDLPHDFPTIGLPDLSQRIIVRK